MPSKFLKEVKTQKLVNTNGTYLVCIHIECLREYIHPWHSHVGDNQKYLVLVYLLLKKKMKYRLKNIYWVFIDETYIQSMDPRLGTMVGNNILVHFGWWYDKLHFVRIVVPHKLYLAHRKDILYVDHQHIPVSMSIRSHHLHRDILYSLRTDFERKHSSQMNIQWLDFQSDQVGMSTVSVY